MGSLVFCYLGFSSNVQLEASEEVTLLLLVCSHI